MGYDFRGEYDPQNEYGAALYFVPSRTLVGAETARRLGIRGEESLYGGVVPFPFVAHKTISHPLVDPDAAAPRGWSLDFSRRVKDSVLFGFSAFTMADARRAGTLVLERGPARVKPAEGTGGRGQIVVSGSAELNAALEALSPEALSRDGVVIEQNYAEITTYSVGQVRLGGLVASYYGTQRLTEDNRRETVYGGSDLVVVRGDYEILLNLELAPQIRAALAHARIYDAAVEQEFPGLLASRRNYDVAFVTDAGGRQRCGVLEQSWRIGGASPAEIAALEAFHADLSTTIVRAASFELYGSDQAPPQNALVHFHGLDERVGPVTKYTILEEYGNTR
jgi:hypothetical protein